MAYGLTTVQRLGSELITNYEVLHEHICKYNIAMHAASLTCHSL